MQYNIEQGEAELRISKLTSVLHHLPSSVGPKQLCALAHLGCTLKANYSDSTYLSAQISGHSFKLGLFNINCAILLFSDIIQLWVTFTKYSAAQFRINKALLM